MAPDRRHQPRHSSRSRSDVRGSGSGHATDLPCGGSIRRDPRGTRAARDEVIDRAGRMTGAERTRMADAGHPEEGWDEASPWYEWGPYLAERAWGSVREDYSAGGDAWNSFPHDHARSRVF